jgi:hypothetical protein
MNLMGQNFSIFTLFAGLVFSVFGVSIFRTGKREANFRRMMIGVSLLAYGFFFTNPWAAWGIGLALLGINYFTPWANGL